MDFVPSILFQYSVIDDEVYDLLKVNMRIEKCEEGTEWTEQGRNHCNYILFFFLFLLPHNTAPVSYCSFFTFHLAGAVVKNRYSMVRLTVSKSENFDSLKTH